MIGLPMLRTSSTSGPPNLEIQTACMVFIGFHPERSEGSLLGRGIIGEQIRGQVFWPPKILVAIGIPPFRLKEILRFAQDFACVLPLLTPIRENRECRG